ncbi:hypothetical protein CPC08DRAFT_401164 [Agrocybe pediades]|nr:hypothetical protein CPC08DRAFT_401164 [Agrocybe pediades]
MERTFTTSGYPVSEVEKKRQYRVVFKEVCTDVGKMKNLGDVMDVLQEVLIPLQLMHCAGWVHRDISSGNVLAYRSNEKQRWQAKLSDLEYAKEFPPTRGRAETKDSKVGTPYFMPHEILKNAYISIPTSVVEQARKELANDDEDSDEMDDDSTEDGSSTEENSPERDLSWHTVVHNPQHDVESLWWLGLWTLTVRVDHSPSRQWAKPIFRDTLNPSDARQAAFVDVILDQLRGCLHPNIRKPFAKRVEKFRERLYESYLLREAENNVLDLNAYRHLYKYANSFFKGIRKGTSKWREQDLKDPQDLEDLHELKRARSMMSNPATTSASREAHISFAQATSSKRRKV